MSENMFCPRCLRPMRMEMKSAQIETQCDPEGLFTKTYIYQDVPSWYCQVCD